MSYHSLPYALLSLDILNSIDDSIKKSFKGLFNTLNEIIKDGMFGPFDDWSVQENNCVLLINDITKKCQTKTAMKGALDVWEIVNITIERNIENLKGASTVSLPAGDLYIPKITPALYLVQKLSKPFEKLRIKYKKKRMKEGRWWWE